MYIYKKINKQTKEQTNGRTKMGEIIRPNEGWVHSSKYRKPSNVSPWAYIRIKAIFDGLIFGGAYIREGLYSEGFWETHALPYSFVGMRANVFLPLVSFSLRGFGGIASRLIIYSSVSPFV